MSLLATAMRASSEERCEKRCRRKRACSSATVRQQKALWTAKPVLCCVPSSSAGRPRAGDSQSTL
eukprot:1960986-Rhodomonas_salina.3